MLFTFEIARNFCLMQLLLRQRLEPTMWCLLLLLLLIKGLATDYFMVDFGVSLLFCLPTPIHLSVFWQMLSLLFYFPYGKVSNTSFYCTPDVKYLVLNFSSCFKHSKSFFPELLFHIVTLSILPRTLTINIVFFRCEFCYSNY